MTEEILECSECGEQDFFRSNDNLLNLINRTCNTTIGEWKCLGCYRVVNDEDQKKLNDLYTKIKEEQNNG